jgi:hypothetical protein
MTGPAGKDFADLEIFYCVPLARLLAKVEPAHA